MRPETITEFVIAALVIIAAIVCAIFAKIKGVSHVTTLAILGSMGGLVSIFFGARHLRRAKPYVKEIAQKDWIIEHLDSYRGVFILIRASEHKHGKFPKVEFQRGSSMNGSASLEYEVADNGDVKITHPRNFFTPPQFRESRVIIRV